MLNNPLAKLIHSIFSKFNYLRSSLSRVGKKNTDSKEDGKLNELTVGRYH